MISVKDYEIVKHVYKEFIDKKDPRSINSSERSMLNMIENTESIQNQILLNNFLLNPLFSGKG